MTEYARSFGLYKQVHDSMPKSHFGKREKPEKKFGKKKKEKEDETEKPPVDQSQQLFTKRLQKSQLKDLEKELRSVATAGGDTY